MYNYFIGDVPVTIACIETNLKQDNFTELFISEDKKGAGFLFEEHILNESDFMSADILEKTGGYELLKTGKGFFVMNHWAKLRYGYGFYIDDLKKNNALPIYFNKRLNEQIPLSVDRFLSTAGLHGMYLRNGGMILHASYIEYRGKAIIFTAPAQTGKSTQAALWEKYMGAGIINGDRVLLRQKETQWTAYGYPCCGSSNICVNKSLPLAAVVVLAQGKDNTVERLSLSQAVRSIVSATEIYPWVKEEVDMAFDRAMYLSAAVPILKLSCRPDEDAVMTLKNYLEAMGIWN